MKFIEFPLPIRKQVSCSIDLFVNLIWFSGVFNQKLKRFLDAEFLVNWEMENKAQLALKMQKELTEVGVIRFDPNQTKL